MGASHSHSVLGPENYGTSPDKDYAGRKTLGKNTHEYFQKYKIIQI